MKRIVPWFAFLKKHMNLPLVVVLFALFIGMCHLFSYLIPFTDNAFVVTNVTPVAADVSGFITAIHVKNGQKVKKNQRIFTVYQPPYQLAYQQAQAAYQEGLKKIIVFKREIDRTLSDIQSIQAKIKQKQYELTLKQNKSVAEAVSPLEIKTLRYGLEALTHQAISLKQTIAVLKAEIAAQRETVAGLKDKAAQAKINVGLTVVRSPGEGVIDNLYVSLNTPIQIHKPIFSFIDTSSYYIQANFNETDLRHVRVGDKAYIILRMYYFNKLFHGEVVNTLWASERQHTAPRSQIQQVSNQNEWLLLPQRFPIQIKINDPDPNYPLNPGASAYVYIATHR